jgi:hypothetical protein
MPPDFAGIRGAAARITGGFPGLSPDFDGIRYGFRVIPPMLDRIIPIAEGILPTTDRIPSETGLTPPMINPITAVFEGLTPYIGGITGVLSWISADFDGMPRTLGGIPRGLDGIPPIGYPVMVRAVPHGAGSKLYHREGVFMPNSDYIPSSDAAFFEWEKILLPYILQNYSKWSIPSPQTTLAPLAAEFEAAYEACQNPNRGKLDTQKKNEARSKLEKDLRVYNKAYLLYNPAVTDDDRTAMGLPIHKGTRSPIQKPETAPQLLPDTGTRRIIKVYYKDEGTSRRGKPGGVKGIEIKWAKLREPPKDIADLVNSAFDTKPPLALEFQEHERGEKVFMCGRWEIHREGGKGPWGNIEEVIIP